MNSVEIDTIIDITGLKCPVPLIQTRKVLKSTSKGKTIKFIGTKAEDISRKEILMVLANLEQTVLETSYNKDMTAWYIITKRT